MPPREVHVTELSLVAFDRAGQRGTFDVACSKGTYVRQIAADLGEGHGCRRVLPGAAAAHHRSVQRGHKPPPGRRTSTDARAPAGSASRWMRLPHLPLRELSEQEGERVCNGRTVGRDGELGPTRLVRDGALLAVASPAGRCPAAGGCAVPMIVRQALRGRARGKPGDRAGQLRRRSSGAPGGDRARRRRCPRPRPDRLRRHLPSAPDTVLRPQLAPRQLSTIARAGGADRGAGGGRAGADPLRPHLLAAVAGRVRRGRAGRGAGRSPRRRWRELPLRQRRSGRHPLARGVGSRLGFTAEAAPLFEIGGTPVSSSRIRDLLAAGEVEQAAELLGRPPGG